MRCRACDKPLTTVRGPGITLTRYWVHVSRWANLTHRAIPPEGM